MIEARLLFGDGTGDVQLPDRAQVVGGGDGTAGGPRLEPVGIPGDPVLTAFDGPTVPSFGPVRRRAIEAIIEELAAAGIPEENVNLVFAHALHRQWADAGLTPL